MKAECNYYISDPKIFEGILQTLLVQWNCEYDLTRRSSPCEVSMRTWLTLEQFDILDMLMGSLRPTSMRLSNITIPDHSFPLRTQDELEEYHEWLNRVYHGPKKESICATCLYRSLCKYAENYKRHAPGIACELYKKEDESCN